MASCGNGFGRLHPGDLRQWRGRLLHTKQVHPPCAHLIQPGRRGDVALHREDRAHCHRRRVVRAYKLSPSSGLPIADPPMILVHTEPDVRPRRVRDRWQMSAAVRHQRQEGHLWCYVNMGFLCGVAGVVYCSWANGAAPLPATCTSSTPSPLASSVARVDDRSPCLAPHRWPHHGQVEAATKTT